MCHSQNSIAVNISEQHHIFPETKLQACQTSENLSRFQILMEQCAIIYNTFSYKSLPDCSGRFDIMSIYKVGPQLLSGFLQ